MSIISFPDLCHVENIQTSGIVSEQVKLKRLDEHVQMISHIITIMIMMNRLLV